jgi:hypothetical protein
MCPFLRDLRIPATFWVVMLVAACSATGTLPPGGGGAGNNGGAGNGGGAGSSGGAGNSGGGSGHGGTGDAVVQLACQSCELASTAPNCARELLTATTTPDPATGDPVAEGWGPDTLPNAVQRDAAVVLLRCLNVHDCATNSTNTAAGSNPVLGCFGGRGTDPVAIIGGTFNGPCADVYKAAAVAQGLNTPGDTDAQFGLAIAQAAFDPTGPVGLADTIKQCALDAPCPICDGF